MTCENLDNWLVISVWLFMSEAHSGVESRGSFCWCCRNSLFPSSTQLLRFSSPTMSATLGIIRAIMKLKPGQDDSHLFRREQQVVPARLRTWHNRRNAHMNRKCRLAPLPICFCDQEDQTGELILHRCPLLYAGRQHVWPTATPLTTKFFCRRRELECTTAFITR